MYTELTVRFIEHTVRQRLLRQEEAWSHDGNYASWYCAFGFIVLFSLLPASPIPIRKTWHFGWHSGSFSTRQSPPPATRPLRGSRSFPGLTRLLSYITYASKSHVSTSRGCNMSTSTNLSTVTGWIWQGAACREVCKWQVERLTCNP